MVIPQTPLFSAILTLHLDLVASDTATAIASLEDNTSAATEPDNQASITPPAGVASLSAPIFDLSGIKSNAAAVKLGASISLATPSDTTEQSSRRIIRLRKRANGNISDSFIQHYIDFGFLYCRI